MLFLFVSGCVFFILLGIGTCEKNYSVQSPCERKWIIKKQENICWKDF